MNELEKDFIVPGVSGVITFLKERMNKCGEDVSPIIRRAPDYCKLVQGRIEGKKIEELTAGMAGIEISTVEREETKTVARKGSFYEDLVMNEREG